MSFFVYLLCTGGVFFDISLIPLYVLIIYTENRLYVFDMSCKAYPPHL